MGIKEMEMADVLSKKLRDISGNCLVVGDVKRRHAENIEVSGSDKPQQVNSINEEVSSKKTL